MQIELDKRDYDLKNSEFIIEKVIKVNVKANYQLSSLMYKSNI